MKFVVSQLGLKSKASVMIWQVLGGVVAPLGVLVVFVVTIVGVDTIKAWF